jgi:CelD/BcsL family acetyltransferase involved in cellulose biosynthesis
MELNIIRELPEWMAIRDAWNDLLARSVVRVPFLRHEFLTAWWTHLGGSQEWPHGELHVVLAHDGGRLVAAAPLFASVDQDNYPVLALMGSAESADYLDFLAEPKFHAPFIDALLDQLAAADGPAWHSIDLFNLLDDSPTRAELQRGAHGLTIRQSLLAACRHLTLESDWESYLARRVDKKHRHEIRRKLRRAEEVPGMRWYFADDVDAAVVAKWLDLVVQHPDKREALTPVLRSQWHDLLLAAHRGGWLRLAFLEIDGMTAAACVAFDFDNRIWVYNIGLEVRFRDLSPCSTLLTFLLQWAISAGRTSVDFLRGDQDFKAWFGAEPRSLYGIRILRVRTETDAGEQALGMAMGDDVLAAGLGAAAIVQRGELPINCRADCEIVTCRMSDDHLLRLFCKFGSAREPAGPTHRYGLGYEARVYDELLCHCPDDVPRLHGAFLDESAQTLVLALEYLEGGTPLHQVTQPKAGLEAAARWIAKFHRWGESIAAPPFLRRYDAEFYGMWLSRAAEVTRILHDRFPWLPILCEMAIRRLPALLPATTIIHGEYQANNLLVYRGRNVPTDWESAAVAAGEIDLAGLTWGWDGELATLCEQQYYLARCRDGTLDEFALRLMAARVFLHLRWLGDFEDDNDREEMVSALKALEPLAAKFITSDR